MLKKRILFNKLCSATSVALARHRCVPVEPFDPICVRRNGRIIKSENRYLGYAEKTAERKGKWAVNAEWVRGIMDAVERMWKKSPYHNVGRSSRNVNWPFIFVCNCCRRFRSICSSFRVAKIRRRESLWFKVFSSCRIELAIFLET